MAVCAISLLPPLQAVVGFCRSQLGLDGCTSEEFDPEKQRVHVMRYMPEVSKEYMGATMVLGARTVCPARDVAVCCQRSLPTRGPVPSESAGLSSSGVGCFSFMSLSRANLTGARAHTHAHARVQAQTHTHPPALVCVHPPTPRTP